MSNPNPNSKFLKMKPSKKDDGDDDEGS